MKKNGERIQNNHKDADKTLDKLLKEALRPVQKPGQELNDSIIRKAILIEKCKV